MQGVVKLGIFLVQLPLIFHPYEYQLSGISLSDFDVAVPCLKFQQHLEFDFPSAVIQTCSWRGVDDSAETTMLVLRDLLEMGCSFETS
jgi:hypothetical protein